MKHTGHQPLIFFLKNLINPKVLDENMIARTVAIDKNRCNGCGLCIKACHEGAMGLVDGKAALVRPNLCDGIGDCLPACPQDAISFVEKDMQKMPDLMARPEYQWPIQLGLVSPMLDCTEELVIAADCTAFTFSGDFKRTFINGRTVVIGCPKLDDRSRFNKIADLIRNNDIMMIHIIRIDIPCCSMLVKIVKDIVSDSGKEIAIEETVIARSGGRL